MFPGWPLEAWLVATSDGRWDAVVESQISDAVAGLAVWPPTGAFAVCEVRAEDEIFLLQRLVTQESVAATAVLRMAPGERTAGLSAEDIDWS